MAYCSVDDVKLAANRWTDLGTDADTRAQAAIARAQAIVDQRTGTWWDQRHLRVTTEPINPRQKRLFMPAPVISLDSVTEDGLDITSSVLNYVNWLEKSTSAAFPWPGDGYAANAWSTNQQSVVVEGQFGWASTPDDIVQVTAHIAAMLLGWVEKSFTTADGLTASIRDLALPDWVKDTLDSRRSEAYDTQAFIVVEL